MTSATSTSAISKFLAAGAGLVAALAMTSCTTSEAVTERGAQEDDVVVQYPAVPFSADFQAATEMNGCGPASINSMPAQIRNLLNNNGYSSMSGKYHADFTNACYIHDATYTGSYVSDYGTFRTGDPIVLIDPYSSANPVNLYEKTKQQADRELLSNLQTECHRAKAHWYQEAALGGCLAKAEAYFGAVSEFGKSYWTKR